MGNLFASRSRQSLEEPHRRLRSKPELQISRTTNGFPMYVCKYDYESRTADDLSFKKGDLLYVISAEEGGWWLAQSEDGREDGYIPSNYVAEYKSLDAEE